MNLSRNRQGILLALGPVRSVRIAASKQCEHQPARRPGYHRPSNNLYLWEFRDRHANHEQGPDRLAEFQHRPKRDDQIRTAENLKSYRKPHQ